MSDQNIAKTIVELAEQRQMNLRNIHAPHLITLPPGYSLEDTTKYQDAPNRYKGSFITNSSEAFADYVIDRDEEPTFFINNTGTTKMICKGIFNLGTLDDPGFGDDVAQLELGITDEFYALCQLERVSQRQLIDFIQDYAYCLTFDAKINLDDESEGMSFGNALNAIRNVTISTAKEVNNNAGEMKTAKSALEEIEAKSIHTLPRFFTMKTPIYDDLPETEVIARVGIITDGDDLEFSVRIIQKKKVLELASKRFVTLVKDLFPGKIYSLYVGTYQAQ